MKPLQLRIDAPGVADELQVPAPVLDGLSSFSISLPEGKVTRNETFAMIADDSFLAGWGSAKPGESLEKSLRALYEEMFSALGDRQLYRVWHFVPGINDWETGLENYRIFCRVRAEAFYRAFGKTGIKISRLLQRSARKRGSCFFSSLAANTILYLSTIRNRFQPFAIR